jgi:hypothetical protein
VQEWKLKFLIVNQQFKKMSFIVEWTWFDFTRYSTLIGDFSKWPIETNNLKYCDVSIFISYYTGAISHMGKLECENAATCRTARSTASATSSEALRGKRNRDLFWWKGLKAQSNTLRGSPALWCSMRESVHVSEKARQPVLLHLSLWCILLSLIRRS